MLGFKKKKSLGKEVADLSDAEARGLIIDIFNSKPALAKEFIGTMVAKGFEIHDQVVKDLKTKEMDKPSKMDYVG